MEHGYAVVLGQIYNRGLPATYRFNWGRTKAYGHIAFNNEEAAYNGRHPVFVEEVIEPLKPDTTYHYRLVAYTASGKVVWGGPNLPYAIRLRRGVSWVHAPLLTN